MFKWTSAFHTQLLSSTLMEPSYSSSDKHLKAELLGASCNLKTFSLELQWSESPGVLIEIPAFSFQVTPKVFEPCSTNFWKEENVQLTLTQKCERKSSRTRKENLSLRLTGNWEPRMHPGTQKTMNIKFLKPVQMRGCLHFPGIFKIYFNLEGRKPEFLLLLITPAFDNNTGICTEREVLQSLGHYFFIKQFINIFINQMGWPNRKIVNVPPHPYSKCSYVM